MGLAFFEQVYTAAEQSDHHSGIQKSESVLVWNGDIYIFLFTQNDLHGLNHLIERKVFNVNDVDQVTMSCVCLERYVGCLTAYYAVQAVPVQQSDTERLK